MDKQSLTQAPAKSNGVTPVENRGQVKVCLRRGCIHEGDPQPAKYFNGRFGVTYDDCRDCRHGPRDRRKGEDDDTGLNGYSPLPSRDWVLPEGCDLLEVTRTPGLAGVGRFNGCDEGEGVKLLTDPKGRPVVKWGSWLKEDEICYVVR